MKMFFIEICLQIATKIYYHKGRKMHLLFLLLLGIKDFDESQ